MIPKRPFGSSRTLQWRGTKPKDDLIDMRIDLLHCGMARRKTTVSPDCRAFGNGRSAPTAASNRSGDMTAKNFTILLSMESSCRFL